MTPIQTRLSTILDRLEREVTDLESATDFFDDHEPRTKAVASSIVLLGELFDTNLKHYDPADNNQTRIKRLRNLTSLHIPDHTQIVFTTGECAKIAKLSQQTIIRACKTNLLKSFKVPGSTHRRILRSDFDTFLKTHNIPAEADL